MHTSSPAISAPSPLALSNHTRNRNGPRVQYRNSGSARTKKKSLFGLRMAPPQLPHISAALLIVNHRERGKCEIKNGTPSPVDNTVEIRTVANQSRLARSSLNSHAYREGSQAAHHPITYELTRRAASASQNTTPTNCPTTNRLRIYCHDSGLYVAVSKSGLSVGVLRE